MVEVNLNREQVENYQKLFSKQRKIIFSKILKKNPKTLEEGLIADFLNGKIEKEIFLKDLIQFKADFNLTDEDIEELSKKKEHFLELLKKRVNVDKVKILVIEDDKKNLKDVKEFLEEKKKKNIPIDTDYATNLKEAITKFNQTKYDCIISDVFFPSNMENDEEIRKELYEKVIDWVKNSYYHPDVKKKHEELNKSWRDGEILAPMGVYFRNYVFSKKPEIGFIFCTSLNHHSDLITAMGPEFSKTDYTEDRSYNEEKKDWELAYARVILKFIAVKNKIITFDEHLCHKDDVMTDLYKSLKDLEQLKKFKEYEKELVNILLKFDVVNPNPNQKKDSKIFNF